MAKELDNKADGFITVTVEDKEYTISGIRRVATHANVDDYTTHWTILTENGVTGNIKR